jgi:hypothetical protein
VKFLASGFQNLDFNIWISESGFLVPVQFSGTSFFHQPDKYPKPDEILRSDLVLIDRIRPIAKKNPVDDFQQQV